MAPRALLLREVDRLGEQGKARDSFYMACFVSATVTASVLLWVARRLKH